LLGASIASIEDAERAARSLVEMGARAALVKGGHLPGGPRGVVTDVLAIGGETRRLRAPRVEAVPHGTGCTLSSLVAGRLAPARSIDDAAIVAAVRWAKRRLARGLARSLRIGDGLSVIPL